MSVCHNLARMINEKSRASQDITDSGARTQPAMPLRRPHGVTSNNKRAYQERGDAGDTNYVAGSSSKASVKSVGSNGMEERSNNIQDKPQTMSSFKQRLYNQERQDESVKASAIVAKPESPKKEEPRINARALFNRGSPASPAQKPDEPKIEPPKPAAAPVPSPNLIPKTVVPDPPTVKPAAAKPQEVAPPLKETPTPVLKPASVSDTTPTRKLLPKNYLLQKCKIGDSLIITVESEASECRVTRGDYVCLTLAKQFEAEYSSLCEDYVIDCNSDDQPAKLIPGETISYFNPDDCGWYRARCLNPTTLALIDSSRIVTVTTADKFRKLPSKYEALPEFCAVLASKDAKLGVAFNCKIVSQTSDGYKVSLSEYSTNAHIGDAEVFRWLPTVEYQPVSNAIPEVSRRPLVDGAEVQIVLANTLDEVYVIPTDTESQRKFNDVMQQVLLKAMKAAPLSEPPHVGQTVISKYVDDIFYRALVRRINVAKNKYQIEYAEYGNIEVTTLDKLYPCPPDCDLSTAPTEVSKLKLGPPITVPAPALELVEEYQETEHFVLTLPDGRKTVPSGSEAILTTTLTKVNLGEKLLYICQPEWKKFIESGVKNVRFQDLEYVKLPEGGCTIQVMHSGALKLGVVCGHNRDDPFAKLIFNKITAKMADYCSTVVGMEPYSPAIEELCIAQLPPHPQWFRAVYISSGVEDGKAVAKLYYIDYGNFNDAPMSSLRRMMPEFVIGLPVLGLYLHIRDFPKHPSEEIVARALSHMKADGLGKGTLKISGWERGEDHGTYIVDAPELIAAIMD